ncbi:MAG: hypothetical protein CMM76_07420 [Rhodospirillaceae bacterium]|nr:hypothetical protein [Rhodospirillaceae bacterium]
MTKQAYDLIGDIHGQAAELEALLKKLGYRRAANSYRHENRKVIFVGDFVDRGPHQRRVIDLVRSMIKSGDALAVMGNHEYNAIAYHTTRAGGGFLRERSTKNTNQHQAFLEEYEGDPSAWADVIDWFKSLPLWLDLEGIRIIHACWEKASIDRVLEFQNGSNLLGEKLLHASGDPTTWQYKAVDTLLKGKEIRLPNGGYFHDKDGNKRNYIRVRWWDKANTYRETYMGPESARAHIPDDPIFGDQMIEYGHTEKPVFLGHYWLEGVPEPLAANIACLDYSVAKFGGKLVAYRWDGEAILNAAKFVSLKRKD